MIEMWTMWTADLAIDFAKDFEINEFWLQNIVNITAIVFGLKYMKKYPIFTNAKTITILEILKNSNNSRINRMKVNVDGKEVWVDIDIDFKKSKETQKKEPKIKKYEISKNEIKINDRASVLFG